MLNPAGHTDLVSVDANILGLKKLRNALKLHKHCSRQSYIFVCNLRDEDVTAEVNIKGFLLFFAYLSQPGILEYFEERRLNSNLEPLESHCYKTFGVHFI